MAQIKDDMTRLLSQAFAPSVLDIVDESAHHRGHQEAGSAQESHFRVMMVSSIFIQKMAIARHRAVHQVLENLLKTSVHALSLTLYTPQEYQALRPSCDDINPSL